MRNFAGTPAKTTAGRAARQVDLPRRTHLSGRCLARASRRARSAHPPCVSGCRPARGQAHPRAHPGAGCSALAEHCGDHSAAAEHCHDYSAAAEHCVDHSVVAPGGTRSAAVPADSRSAAGAATSDRRAVAATPGARTRQGMGAQTAPHQDSRGPDRAQMPSASGAPLRAGSRCRELCAASQARARPHVQAHCPRSSAACSPAARASAAVAGAPVAGCPGCRPAAAACSPAPAPVLARGPADLRRDEVPQAPSCRKHGRSWWHPEAPRWSRW